MTKTKEKWYGKGYYSVRMVKSADYLIKADSLSEAIDKVKDGLLNTEIIDEGPRVIEYPTKYMTPLSDTLQWVVDKK